MYVAFRAGRQRLISYVLRTTHSPNELKLSSSRSSFSLSSDNHPVVKINLSDFALPSSSFLVRADTRRVESSFEIRNDVLCKKRKENVCQNTLSLCN
jgi:hypothetical protein